MKKLLTKKDAIYAAAAAAVGAGVGIAVSKLTNKDDAIEGTDAPDELEAGVADLDADEKDDGSNLFVPQKQVPDFSAPEI